MPDPHVLYVVAAVVVAGLVAWVIVVLSRPVNSDPGAPAKSPPLPPSSAAEKDRDPVGPT